MRRRATARAAAGVAVLACVLVAPAQAMEPRRVEALGVVAADAGAAGGTAPRDAALADALARALLEVALELHAAFGVEPADPGPSLTDPGAITEEAQRALEERLSNALGAEPLDYVLRFQILEDRGRRPRLLLDDPDVESEYIVLVEVVVDVERVHGELVAAGLLTRETPPALPVGRVRLVLEDLRSWRALEALRSAWIEHGAATAIEPVEFQRGRAVLELSTPLEPAALGRALQDEAPAGLELVPLGAAPGRLALRVIETPLDGEGASGADSTTPPPTSRPRPAASPGPPTRE